MKTNLVNFNENVKEQTLIIVGANGMAMVAIDIAEEMGFGNIYVLDDIIKEEPDMELLGRPIVGVPEEFEQWIEQGFFFLAMEDSNERMKWSEQLKEKGVKFMPLVHKQAAIGQNVALGPGCLIEAGAVIAPECSIGPFTHIGAGSTLGYECNIGKACEIGAGAHLAPETKMDLCTTVDMGAIVK